MKSALSFVILILSSFSAFATVYHSDGSAINVQYIHDTQAVDGDTITIPAGSFSWTTHVNITKAVIIQGQTTTDTVNGTANDQTSLVDNLVRVSGGQGYFNINNGARITGITFTGQGGLQTPMSNGAIRIGGDVPVRIDHCHFKHLNHSPMISIWNANFGVGDHNLFDDFVDENFSFRIEMSDYGGGGADNGDGAFADVAGYGGPNFWFIEDNYINYTHWNGGGGGGVDAFHGGKYVFRHNKVFNATTLGHSTGSTWPRGRGVRAEEIYNNEWHMDTLGTIDGTTSGSALYHDNSFFGVLQYGIGLQVYRAIWSYGSPFYGADGLSPWDVNDAHGLYESGTATSGSNTSIMDSGKNWTTNQWAGYSVKRASDGATALITGNSNNTLQIDSWLNENWTTGNRYEIRRVLIILDQPGRGRGDLLIGNPPTPAAWPNQELEPCYSWNNIHSPGGEHLNFSRQTGGQTILQGRDYFNDTPMPGYTPYVYPHPLVLGGSPTPTPTPSSTPSPTAIPTATATATATPTASSTATATATPTATATVTATPTPTATPASTPTPTPPVGLVAAYNFNEGSGTTLTDASGNGITGNIIDATWTTEGRNGNALSFNGLSSYVDLGNPALLQITESMTWSAWVKAAANPADDGQIVAKADDASGWQLKTSPDTGQHTFGVRVAGATNTFARRYSTTVRSLNVWYHVAGVYNASAQTLDIYVNGVLDNGTLRGIIPASQLNAAVNVNIGRRTSFYGGFYFNGVIDDLRIYNRALSQTEIQADMNTPVGSPPPTPTATPTATATSTPTATPTPDQCEVPNFIGLKFNHAQSTWNDAGFTTEVIILPRLDNPNYISWQSLPEGFIGSCSDTTIIVQ